MSNEFSRRGFMKKTVGVAGAAAVAPALPLSAAYARDRDERDRDDRRHMRIKPGPVGFTTFIHPTVALGTHKFSIGAASFIDAYVTLEGKNARIGNAVNLQDNDRLLNYYNRHNHRGVRGDLKIGDGTFTAHGVSFVGKVRIGDACGTGINAIVQNARVHDACFTGLVTQILGTRPHRPIEIPEASLVLFGARIRSQDDVAANIIPAPAPFSIFFADVDEENLVLARGFNLLHRAAQRVIPFSDVPGDPRNPGDDFPGLDVAFGKLGLAPPTIYRRGNGVIPGRQASLADLGFERFEPLSPVPTPSTPAPDNGGLGMNAPASDSPASGARFLIPRVASPELIDEGAGVVGGCELASGVIVGAGSYVLGDIAAAVSVGAGTVIGRHSSLHELTYTACRVGTNCIIGDHVVLHGPVELGNNVVVGDGAVIFGPTIRDGVRIGRNALVFGPVEVTEDVPDDAIIVPPGQEFLIAPSAPLARATMPTSPSMLAQWKRAQDAGSGCNCGIGGLVHLV